VFENHKQLDSTQWFRGFVHEVLDLSPAAGGLRALVAHPRESSPGEQGETAVVFFAAGIDAVAVAAWKWKLWTNDSRPWHGLFRILEEPVTHFVADSSIVSLRTSLLKLNQILTARAAGDPIADILLSSSASGAALELAQLAKPKLRFARLRNCQSLEAYLAEFPTKAPTSREMVNGRNRFKTGRPDPKEENWDYPDAQEDTVKELEESETTQAPAGGQALPICSAITLLPPNLQRSSTLPRVGRKDRRSVSVASSQRRRASHLPSEQLEFELPDVLFSLSPTERRSRCTLSHDLCTLDEKRIFLLGVLPLPVHGTYFPYCLRLWAEVEPSALQQAQGWYAEGPAPHQPLPGELANRVPLVPTTTGLPVLIYIKDKREWPIFFLRESEHPLSAEQQMGIGMRRAVQYARARAARRDWARA